MSGFGCCAFDYLHFEGYLELICDLIWQDSSNDRTGTWRETERRERGGWGEGERGEEREREREEKEVPILKFLAINERGHHDRK